VKKINWGIIGLGTIALQFANGFRFSKNAKLLGVASKDLHKVEKFQKEFNIDKSYCFNNYENLLENNKIDIIYIALPTSLHHEWISKSLDRGKKVLVEKPATMNSSEIIDIKEKYFSNKVFFSEAFMYMYHPQIKKTIELINKGEIGDLISMESSFGNDILTKKNFFGFKKRKKLNPESRLYNKKLGGGAILDLGCYPVSFTTLIASKISTINYDKIKILNKQKEIGSTDVDLDSYMELHFDNNFASKVSASFTKNLGKKTIIIGSKGEICIQDTWMANPAIISIKNEGKKELKMDSNENIYSYEIESLSQCILENKSTPEFPGTTINDIIGNMKILDKWIS
jgi:predicted dehydrogenase